MGILSIPNELLLVIGEDLAIKDLFYFLLTRRRMSSLLTPRLHERGVQDVEDGLTALQWAALHGKESLAILAISRGAELNEPCRQRSGLTPLHLAAEQGHHGVIEILVKRGAEIDVRYDHAYTPLHLAAWYGQEEAIRVLLRLGADMMCVTPFGDAPAHFAVGNLKCLKAFIDAGFNPNTARYNNRTILHDAVFYRSGMEIVEYLLEKTEAKASINTKDSRGETPLKLAEDGAIARLLLRYGASPEMEVKRRNRP